MSLILGVDYCVIDDNLSGHRSVVALRCHSVVFRVRWLGIAHITAYWTPIVPPTQLPPHPQMKPSCRLYGAEKVLTVTLHYNLLCLCFALLSQKAQMIHIPNAARWQILHKMHWPSYTLSLRMTMVERKLSKKLKGFIQNLASKYVFTILWILNIE